jgi:hypothetical protein
MLLITNYARRIWATPIKTVLVLSTDSDNRSRKDEGSLTHSSPWYYYWSSFVQDTGSLPTTVRYYVEL